ncbi:MAG TPA: AAA family ATPase [Drouetiella sp.]
MIELPPVNLSDEQRRAIAGVIRSLSVGLVALAGPAGSGKTTVIKELVRQLDEIYGYDVTVCAPTNKAAHVLKSKGIWDATTLHAACLSPKFKPPLDKLANFLDQVHSPNGPHDIEKPGELCKFCYLSIDQDNRWNECSNNPPEIDYPKALVAEYGREKLDEALSKSKHSVTSGLRFMGIKDVFKYVESWLPRGKAGVNEVLIIDEASMVGEFDLQTAQKVFDIIILVGDEAQLPPVKGEPSFWKVPNRFELTEIHRQATGSQPLDIAIKIRNGQKVVPTPVQAIDLELSSKGIPVIVWKNKTRIDITNEIRKKLGYANMPPQVGETLICKGGDRMAKARGLINNSLWTVKEADDFVCTLEGADGELLEGEHLFIEELDRGEGVPFRFAYAITAHSSQGSQWSQVMIHEPDCRDYFAARREEATRFLYTSVTRAEKKVLWVNRVA